MDQYVPMLNTFAFEFDGSDCKFKYFVCGLRIDKYIRMIFIKKSQLGHKLSYKTRFN